MRNIRSSAALALAVIGVFAGVSNSQRAVAATPATPATPVKVTEVEGISEYRLANGLRVLLFPDQSKATITVNVTYLSARVTRTTARRAWRTCLNT